MLLEQKSIWRTVIAAAVIAAGSWLMAATVSATSHGADRVLPAGPVAPGSEVIITVQVRDYGKFGRVTEMLPAGWEYVGSSLLPAAVDQENGAVRFLLLDESEFTYTVTAPDEEGSYAFAGVIEDSRRSATEIGGDSQLEVQNEPAPAPAITRSPSATPSPVATETTTPESQPEPAEETEATVPEPQPKPAEETGSDPIDTSQQPGKADPAPEATETTSGLVVGIITVTTVAGAAVLVIYWRRRVSRQ